MSCSFLSDLAKAFDTVLLATIENMRNTNNCVQLFRSRRCEHKQCIIINNTYSDYKKIEHSVPQGTELEPILFTAYVNGLFSNISKREKSSAENFRNA